MHQIIDYAGLDPIAKHNKAIEDVKEFLGKEKFDKLTKEFREVPQDQMSLDKFTNYVSLAGIQGYPVKAWYNYIYGL